MRALLKRSVRYSVPTSALTAYRKGSARPRAGCRAGTCNPATRKYPHTTSFFERPEKGGAVELHSADAADRARFRQFARHYWSAAPAHDELGLSAGGDDQLLALRQAINQTVPVSVLTIDTLGPPPPVHGYQRLVPARPLSYPPNPRPQPPPRRPSRPRLRRPCRLRHEGERRHASFPPPSEPPIGRRGSQRATCHCARDPAISFKPGDIGFQRLYSSKRDTLAHYNICMERFDPNSLYYGKYLALALPPCRPVIVDLNCGTGALLRVSANSSTRFLLGARGDPLQEAGKRAQEPELVQVSPSPPSLPVTCITHDLTLLYPLLKRMRF